jgi:hypothetical protein
MESKINDQKFTISIPYELKLKLEKYVLKEGFSSLPDCVEKILLEAVSNCADVESSKESFFGKNCKLEEEKVKQRLMELGYLD